MSGGPVTTLAEWRAQHRAGTPPKILVDAEVRALVDQLLKTATFEAIAQRCSELFGAARAPSRSSVARYWRHLTNPDGPDIARGGPVHGRAGRCLYCGAQLKAAAQRPSKRFCGDACRNVFHSISRRYVVEEVAAGRLSVAELRRHAQTED